MLSKQPSFYLPRIEVSKSSKPRHYKPVFWIFSLFLLLLLLIFGWLHLSGLSKARQESKSFVARYVLPVTFSPNGQVLAAAQGQVTAQLWIWDLSTNRLQHTIETGHNAAVWALAFSPDGKSIISAGRDDGRLIMWDAQTGNKKEIFSGSLNTTESLFFSFDGSLLINAGSDLKPTIEIWDVKAKKLINTHIEGQSGSAFAAPMPDGQTFLTTGNNGIRIRELPSGKVRRVVQTSQGDKECLNAVLSPDGGILAKGIRSVSGGEENIEIWDVETGALLNTWSENQGSGKTTWKSSLTALIFSPDGKLLASSSIFGTPHIRLRDARTGKVLRTLSVEAQSLAFSPDGKTLAIGTQGEVQLHKVDALLGQRNS